jgi:hypothetical protein
MKKSLTLVTLLSVGTALTTLGNTKPVAASLTPPTAYDYSYTWNATDTEQYLNVNGVDSIPLYTRTADGVYYNYTSTFELIKGLTVTMTFNRSNTAWQSSGAFYKPDEDKIGSDNTVGAIAFKFDIRISNQTNKNFIFILDHSSSTSGVGYVLSYNNVLVLSSSNSNTTSLKNYFVPSYTDFQWYYNTTSSTRYFDAWYLQDLGISESYQQGYDANRTGILTDYLGTDAQQIGWVLLGIAAILFVFKGGK